MLMGGREHFHTMQEVKESRREEVCHVEVNEPKEVVLGMSEISSVVYAFMFLPRWMVVFLESMQGI